MSTFIAWWWTKIELSPLWRKITLRRHRSELRALRAARYMGPFAGFPIFLTVAMWSFVLAGIPSLFLFLLTQGLTSIGGDVAIALATTVFTIHSLYALLASCLVAPWFFRWYFIGSGLMFGHTAMADRKEAELVTAMAAAKAPS